jgi:hypothetical protein
MKQPLLYIIFIVFAIISTACQKGYETYELIGKWGVDSIYTYYNGFSYMSTDNFIPATYTYAEDGTLQEEKLGGGRTIYYRLTAPDSLIYESADQTILGRYHIQKLDHHQLVLEKDKEPLFEGKEQQRYEVRFFSKLTQ